MGDLINAAEGENQNIVFAAGGKAPLLLRSHVLDHPQQQQHIMHIMPTSDPFTPSHCGGWVGDEALGMCCNNIQFKNRPTDKTKMGAEMTENVSPLPERRVLCVF